MWRAWWRYGTQQWTFRDYARHFGYVSGVAFAATWVAVVTPLFP